MDFCGLLLYRARIGRICFIVSSSVPFVRAYASKSNVSVISMLCGFETPRVGRLVIRINL